MLGFDTLPLTSTRGRCELCRPFEQQTPVYVGETFFVSTQGAIWPSPASRSWDFTQDPGTHGALVASPAGLPSKGEQIGGELPGIASVPALASQQTPFPVLVETQRFPASPLDANGVSGSIPSRNRVQHSLLLSQVPACEALPVGRETRAG